MALRLTWTLVLFLSLRSLAFGAVEVMLWQPEGYEYAFALPRRAAESPAQAWRRYRRALAKDPELKSFADALKGVHKGKSLPWNLGTGPAVLAIGNAEGDLGPDPARMNRILGPLAERGARVQVLPVAATAGLLPEESAEFRRALSQDVDLLFAVGGDDIDPSLYKSANRHARKINPSRDAGEFQLVKQYLSEGQGFYAGVCRGHQMGAVASGCELVQDIHEELGTIHPSGEDHPIKLKEESAGALTREIFGGDGEVVVNSTHHQSVLVKEGDPGWRVTAVASGEERIAEVAEFSRGRGLTVQFHPERMTDSPVHQRFFDVLYGEAARVHGRRIGRPYSVGKGGRDSSAGASQCGRIFRQLAP
jgi:putative glutamine amidotransferase